MQNKQKEHVDIMQNLLILVNDSQEKTSIIDKEVILSTSDRKYYKFSKNFATKKILININELTEVLKSDWAAIVWVDGLRDAGHFLSAQIIVLDIDNESDINNLNLDKAQEILEKSGLLHVVALSRNHQKPKHDRVVDRFRILLFLEEPIKSLETYKSYYNSLTDLLPFIDQATKDGARQWYATPEIVSFNLENGYFLKQELINNVVKSKKDKLPKTEEIKKDWQGVLDLYYEDLPGSRNKQINTLCFLISKTLGSSVSEEELIRYMLSISTHDYESLKNTVHSAYISGIKEYNNIQARNNLSYGEDCYIMRILAQGARLIGEIGGDIYCLHPDGEVTLFKVTNLSALERHELKTVVRQDKNIVNGVKFAGGKDKFFYEGNFRYLNYYTAPYIPENLTHYDDNILKPFFWLLDNLFNKNKEHIEFIIDWLAYLMQHPDKPLIIAPCLMSYVQGIGKGLLLNTACHLVGIKNSAAVDEEKLLTSGKKFNQLFFTKLLIICEETSWNAKGYQTIKNLITMKYGEKENKGKDEVQAKRSASFCFSSNTPGRIWIDQGDRRLVPFIWEGSEKDKIDFEEAGEYDKLLGETDFIHALRYFLINRNITYSMSRRPAFSNLALKEMQSDYSFSKDQRLAEKIIREKNRVCLTILEVHDWTRDLFNLSDHKLGPVLRYLGYVRKEIRGNDKKIRLWIQQSHEEESSACIMHLLKIESVNNHSL